jgi:uncharacterized protein
VDPRYRELTARVDGFVARVTARHPADLRCAPGCDGCCRTRLTIAAVEAEAIEAWAATLSAIERATIADAARASSSTTVRPEPIREAQGERSRRTDADVRCAALDDDGRCRIYPARPLVCRSHGVPVRLRSERGLPVITACELNFTARGPAAADTDCVLDQELVSTTLGLIDRAAGGGAPRPRRALADVLAALADDDARATAAAPVTS